MAFNEVGPGAGDAESIGIDLAGGLITEDNIQTNRRLQDLRADRFRRTFAISYNIAATIASLAFAVSR